jgi:hypothetical protein
VEWLFSWEVASWFIAAFIAAAFAFLAMDDFKLAKLFFLLAAANAVGGIAIWGAKCSLPGWQRNAIIFLLCGGLGVLCTQAFRYVDAKRREKESPKDQVLPTTLPWHIPASIRTKYSSQQTIEISNVPGKYNRTLNLDNVATLQLTAPFTGSLVTLAWPTTPTFEISKPIPGQRYEFPGGDAYLEFAPGMVTRYATLIGPSRNIQFDAASNQSHLLRVRDRVFRVTLESIKDKREPGYLMFFEYVFGISEEDSTPETRRRAISSDDFGPDLVLRPLREYPQGTIELKLRETVNNQPNIVRFQAGQKAFLFDPVARQLSFQMTTANGRLINLQRPLDTRTDAGGRHLIVLVWDETKGAQLWIGGQVIKEGLE